MTKLELSKRVGVAWLLITLTLCASFVIIWKVAVLDAPPSNSVLITNSQDTNTTGGKDAINLVSTATLGTNELRTAPAAVSASQGSEVDSKNGFMSVIVSGTEVVAIPTETPELLAVYVSGAVQKPGVYTLPVGSRVAEALGAAGGPVDGADVDNLNLAERLSDEEHVAVPHVGDTPSSRGAVNQVPTPKAGRTATRTKRNTATPHTEGTPGRASTPQREHTPASQPKPVLDGKININTASEQELEALPGIGPSLAGKIVAYRAANGPFQAIEDIMRVPGIKEGVFSKMRDHITVGP
jgi:competence protein ComEA